MPTADAASLYEYELRMRFADADATDSAKNGRTGLFDAVLLHAAVLRQEVSLRGKTALWRDDARHPHPVMWLPANESPAHDGFLQYADCHGLCPLAAMAPDLSDG